MGEKLKPEERRECLRWQHFSPPRQLWAALGPPTPPLQARGSGQMRLPLCEFGAGGAPAPGCGCSVCLSVSAPSESEEAGEELCPGLGAGAPLCISAEAALQ